MNNNQRGVLALIIKFSYTSCRASLLNAFVRRLRYKTGVRVWSRFSCIG